VLAAVWLVAGGIILVTKALRPTPESLVAYVRRHPLEGLSPGERTKVLDRVAAQLNALDFDQREQLRKLRGDRQFFSQLSPEERNHFVDLTLPEGFRQLMIALNKMKPEQRKKIVQRALDDIEKQNPELNDRLDRADVQKVLSQGMDSFYQNASVEVKLDFAPVIERIQQVTQSHP